MDNFVGSLLPELLNPANGIITAFIAGFFAVIGAIVGGLMARNTDAKRAKGDRIRDAYMQFLSIVFVAMHKKDNETIERLGVAVSRIEIFCSKQAAEYANSLSEQLLAGVSDNERFSEQLDQFF